MIRELQITFGIGIGVSFLAAALALIVFAIYLTRKRVSSAICTAAAFGLLCIVYTEMIMDFWPKQRKDGVEFPWYRDVAHIPIGGLIAVLGAHLLEMSLGHEAIYVGTMMVGYTSLTLANFMTATDYWWGWAGAIAAFILAEGFFIYRYGENTNYFGWAGWAASLVYPVCIPLVQVLSWTMQEVLGDSPDRKTSEFAYLVVEVVGIAAPFVVLVVAVIWYAIDDARHKKQQ